MYEKAAASGLCQHGNFPGRCPSCQKETSLGRRELLDIVASREQARTMAVLEKAVAEWQRLEQRDGAAAMDASVGWYEVNNHRVNLYEAIGSNSEEWSHEDRTGRDAEHLLAMKKLDIGLKQLAGSDHPDESAQKLAEFVGFSLPAHNRETAIDSLSRLGPAGAAKLELIMTDNGAPERLRLRAAASGLRFGAGTADFSDKCAALLKETAPGLEGSDLYSAIELAGLVGGEAGRAALATIREKVAGLPPEKRPWYDRDLISTGLAIGAASKEDVARELNGRAWEAEGIIFGSLAEMPDFADFIAKNRDKIKTLATALKRTNEAFGAEPVLFVDVIPDSMAAQANEGWTQNSIHLSRSLLEHPRISAKTSMQSAIHEACERWESKGLVDADMERDYLQLMGDKYDGSQLDKFRLKHRYDIPNAGAGHPWDGTREYMAEAGSVLLAEPEVAKRWLGGSEGEECAKALKNVRGKIQQHAGKTAEPSQ